MEIKTFLVKHKASRKPRLPGEVFAMEFQQMGFVWGRVVSNRCAIASSLDGPIDGPWHVQPDVYLIYIFKQITNNLILVPSLDVANLLLPPVLTFRGGWTKGYFIHVEQRPFQSGEVLDQHCFWSLSSHPHARDGKIYIDEIGRTLPGPVKPCGEHGIMDFGFIEHMICKAMKIRSPFE